MLTALASALSMAVMVMFDRIMMGDCYRNKADQAWFVSSVAGSVFGLIATVAMWLGYSAMTETTVLDIMVGVSLLSVLEMVAMTVAGACSVQALRHYLRLFVQTEKGEVNETAIAMWLASTPIFIFTATILLNIFNLNRGILSGLTDAELTFGFGAAVIVTVVLMIRFETYQSHASNLFARFGEVIKMQMMFVCYTLIISGILRDAEMTTVTALAIQPFFWVGFAAGTRTMVIKQNRIDFARNWGRIKKFVYPIIVVEIIGMFVYFFEFFALKDVDPTLVNLIIGAHIVPVFLLVIALSRLRHKMEVSKIRRMYFMRLRLVAKNLPNETSNFGKFTLFALVLLALLSTILMM